MDHTKNRSSIIQNAYANLLSSLLGITILIIIAREVIGGFLRYYLDKSSIGFIWFTPDAALFAIIILRCANSIAPPKIIWWVIILIAGQSAIGYLIYHNWTAVSSAVKMLLPLIAVLMLPPTYLQKGWWSVSCLLLLILGVSGIIMDISADFPWTGYTYSQFGVEREASREWWIKGEQRIAGFGLSSSSSATSLLLLTILVARNIKVKLYKAAVYLIAIAALEITTSRTNLIALSVAATIDLWPYKLLNNSYAGKYSLISLGCIALFGPLISSIFLITADFPPIDPYKSSSLYIRFFNVWPMMVSEAFEGNLLLSLLGHGYGSVGSPAHLTGVYVSPYSAVDNLFIYLLYQYGIFSFIITIYYIATLGRIGTSDRHFGYVVVIIAATLNCHGVIPFILIGFTIWFGRQESVEIRLPQLHHKNT